MMLSGVRDSADAPPGLEAPPGGPAASVISVNVALIVSLLLEL
jgi:hypothetical protein